MGAHQIDLGDPAPVEQDRDGAASVRGVAGQLEEVTIRRDDHGVDALVARLLGERPERVIGLVPLDPDDRDPQRVEHLLDERQLRSEVRRRLAAAGLVLGVHLQANGRLARVEGHRDQVGLLLREELDQHGGEPVHGVGHRAAAGGECRREREEGSVREAVAVQEEELPPLALDRFSRHESHPSERPRRVRRVVGRAVSSRCREMVRIRTCRESDPADRISAAWSRRRFGASARSRKVAVMSTADVAVLGAVAGFTIFLGLPIGRAAHADEVSLALLLVVGFGLHNATEGFGIVGPLVAADIRPAWSWLVLAGLVAGGPTFFGTLIGNSISSVYVFVAFLTLAAGAILYVIGELFSVGRRLSWEITLWGVLIGFLLGLGTELIIVAAGA